MIYLNLHLSQIWPRWTFWLLSQSIREVSRNFDLLNIIARANLLSAFWQKFYCRRETTGPPSPGRKEKQDKRTITCKKTEYMVVRKSKKRKQKRCEVGVGDKVQVQKFNKPGVHWNSRRCYLRVRQSTKMHGNLG